MRRAPSALWRNAGRDVLVTSLDREEIEILPGTAGHIWRLLEVPRSLEELAGILSDFYDASVDTIIADVAVLLEDLRRRGLVEEV